MRCKDLESLRERISYHESHLGEDPSKDNTPSDDGLFGHGAEAEMATAPGADDAPSESATTQASDPPPTEGQTHAMEMDDEGIRSPPASPVSPANDGFTHWRWSHWGGGGLGPPYGLVSKWPEW